MTNSAPQQLREAAGRVQAIARVHDLLSDEKRLGEASDRCHCPARRRTGQRDATTARARARFRDSPSDIVVPSQQATMLALADQRAGFQCHRSRIPRPRGGKIILSPSAIGGWIRIRVINDGNRIPGKSTASTSVGLGLRIVERLAQSDLGGAFSISLCDGNCGGNHLPGSNLPARFSRPLPEALHPDGISGGVCLVEQIDDVRHLYRRIDRSSDAVSCMAQPGFAVITSTARVCAVLAALRSPSSFAISGPQQVVDSSATATKRRFLHLHEAETRNRLQELPAAAR